MKVRCVNNINSVGVTCNITINKIYNILHENKIYYVLLSDENVETSYYKYRFVEINKDRKEKLKKINSL